MKVSVTILFSIFSILPTLSNAQILDVYSIIQYDSVRTALEDCVIELSATDATCGNNNGAVSVTVTGGHAPFAYLWSNGSITSSITNLPDGPYTVTVTGGNCATSASVELGSSVNITTVLSCSGNCNHSATGNPSSGGTYTFLWLPTLDTTPTITNLCAGIYTLTITDVAGNTCTSSVTIPELNPVNASVIVNPVTSCSNNNGSVSITPSGGNGSFTYAWNTGSITQNISNLAAGTYLVTVTSLSCTATASATVEPHLFVTARSSYSCNSVCTDTAIGNAINGVPPYSYVWQPTNDTTPAISNLCPGLYTLVVTDAEDNSCTKVVNIPGPLTAHISSLTPTECGLANGRVTVTASGGNSSFTYLWSNGVTTPTISKLPSGDYTVTISSGGCTATAGATVNASPVVSLASTCGDTCEHALTAMVTNGVPPYHYLWQPSNDTTPAITNLCAGSYTLIVTDVEGNSCTTTSNITQYAPVTATISPVVHTTCNNNNGSAVVSAGGGNGNYTYVWSNGKTTSSNTKLAPGIYYVTVVSGGCTATASVTINTSIGVGIVLSPTATPCGTPNGAVSSAVSGGNGTFSYVWSNGATVPAISNLSAGTYRLTVTSGGCTASSSANVTSIPIAVSILPTPTSCGLSNGSASVTASGGIGTYTYLWSNGGTDTSVSNLSAGTHRVTVTGGGCNTTASVVISSSQPLKGTTSVTSTSCGNNNGSISVTTSGGNGPLSYLWSTGDTTSIISNLAPATYSLTITAGTCTTVKTATVNSSPSVSAAASSASTTCGQANGSAVVSVSGGNGSFTYYWSNGNISPSLSNLAAGNYTVTVTSGNCTMTASTTVNASQGVAGTSTSTPTTCGNANGSATVSASGGSGAYTYLWSNGTTTPTISNVFGGNYNVVVSSGGCTTTVNATINSSQALIASLSATATTCGNSNGSATVTASGGNGAFTYLWTNGETTPAVSNLAAGSYVVTVTSGLCTVNKTATVNPSVGVTASTSAVSTTCGSNNGLASVTGGGGNGFFTYLWSNGRNTQTIISLAPAIYNVTVTSAGCSAASSAVINSSTGFTISTSSSPATCGQANGSALVTIAGGSGSFTYQWSNGSPNPSITNIPGGNYFVTVTGSGCTSTASATVGSTAAVTAFLSSSSATCGNDNGSATIVPSGGNSVFSYLWSNGAIAPVINNLSPGTYSVTVTSGGCSAIDSVAVTLASNAVTLSSSSVNETCRGNNGSASAIAGGGNGAFSYLWNTGHSTANILNLTAGNYTVTVTSGGCSQTASAVVNAVGNTITVLALAIDASCGLNNGTVSASAASGSAPYSYLWSNGAATQTVPNLGVGAYIVSVTDQLNCSGTASVVVNSSINALTLSVTPVDARCGNNSGSVTALAGGGNGSFSYIWSNGGTTASIANLVGGNYTLTVTSGVCSQTANAVVNMLGNAVALSTSSTDASCGNSNGNGGVSITSGSAPFVYEWSNGSNTPVISNIGAGTYTVTVTGNGNCSDTAAITINSTEAVGLISSFTDAGCNSSNGSASVMVTSGSSPFTYGWSNGGDTSRILNLTSGTYSVTVTSSDGCTALTNVTVTSSDGVTLLASAVNTTCGSNNGSASATPVTGTAPFIYYWSTGDTSIAINNLGPGTYLVTATDINGCSSTARAEVDSSNSLLATISSAKTIMCSGDTTGICATGGFATYVWNTGQSGLCINATLAGNYYVTVTDNSGCSAESNHLAIKVHPLPPVAISVNADTLTAYDAVTYQWFKDGLAIIGATSNIHIANQGGSYSVEVTDTNGCLATSIPVLITDLDDLSGEDAINVYPNPLLAGSWELTVGKKLIGAVVEVFDNNGRVVYNMKLEGRSLKLEMEVSHGIYLLRISSSHSNIVKKLIRL